MAQWGPPNKGMAAGQNVQPVYEGWERNADGTVTMWFGYYNRNYEESVEIAVGSQNTFGEDGIDKGQPTHFLPRRQRYVFGVILPKASDVKRRLVRTLSA